MSQKLSQLEGVSEVDINGAEEERRPGRGRSCVRSPTMGLALSEQVSTAIQSANVNGPKGSIQGDDRALMITADRPAVQGRPRTGATSSSPGATARRSA